MKILGIGLILMALSANAEGPASQLQYVAEDQYYQLARLFMLNNVDAGRVGLREDLNKYVGTSMAGFTGRCFERENGNQPLGCYLRLKKEYSPSEPYFQGGVTCAESSPLNFFEQPRNQWMGHYITDFLTTIKNSRLSTGQRYVGEFYFQLMVGFPHIAHFEFNNFTDPAGESWIILHSYQAEGTLITNHRMCYFAKRNIFYPRRKN